MTLSFWEAGVQPDFAFSLGLEAPQMFQNALPSFPPVAFSPCSQYTHRNKGCW